MQEHTCCCGDGPFGPTADDLAEALIDEFRIVE